MPTFKNFITPHCHISSLDSASTPEAFIKREIELETGAITCSDHGTLQAVRQVYDLANKNKLTPILGIEAYFRDDDCPILTAAGIEKDKDGTVKEFFKYGHVTMHCLDETAYSAMCRILTDADSKAEKHGSERKPIFNWANLEELGSYNVTCGSGCLIGMVQRFIMQHGRYDIAEAYYSRLRGTFKPGNFFVESFPHVCDRNWDETVVVTFKDGSTENFKIWKSIKTDKKPSGKKEGWKARDLANNWRKSHEGHGCLRAVMIDRKWVEIEQPKEIVSVEHREGFIVNDCQPWAPGGDLQYGCNEAVIELAKKYGDKILISDDSHFVTPDEKIIQDVRLQQSGSWRFSGSHHRYSSDEAWNYFHNVLDIPQAEFEGWIENSVEWSQRFKGFKFTSKPELPTKFYPENTLKHTYSIINRNGRMKDDPVYRERLLSEIELLNRNGTIDFLPYFFIDEEVVSLYERHGELTGPGRGSAAGLLLAYLEGITHVDPIKYGLSKDRFMTLDRVKAGAYPDIDQDLGERDTILVPWLEKRFPGHFAQVSVDSTLKLRSSVKDVARWKRAENGHGGYVPPEIEALAAKFAEAPQGVTDYDFVFGYKGAEEWVPGSLESDPALQVYATNYSTEWDIVKKCLGLTRQKGRHASAFAITQTPIKNFIPLTSVSGVTVTQFTAKSVEAMGAIKMDFLIVLVIKDISRCIRLIQQSSSDQSLPWHSAYTLPDDPNVKVPSTRIDGIRVPLLRVIPFKGKYVDVYDLPEDQNVFKDFCEGRTETVFQFSTPGAIKWLKQFNHRKPNGSLALSSITDLAVFNALNRPGGLDAMVAKPGQKKSAPGDPGSGKLVPDKVDPNSGGDQFGPRGGTGVPKITIDKHNMLVEYVNRALGKGNSPDIIPIFEQLIPETYGVMVFQEQVEYMYKELTGCTGSEAEEFRRLVAKKKMNDILKKYDSFIEGAGRKVGVETAKEVWNFFVSFAAYGFNKSHAVSYSFIGYACAWLKHHFPLEWWASVLSNADRNKIKEKYWPHCGHLVSPPDINKSGDNFVIDGNKILAPLDIIQGIGPAASAELNAGRPYKDMDDFCQKIVGQKAKKVKVKDDDGTEKEKNGRSSLHRGIVSKLIFAGVMDSLFGPDVLPDVGSKLEAYEKTIARLSGKKKWQPPNAFFSTLNQLQRYQLKKDVLSAYGTDLIKVVLSMGIDGFEDVGSGYEYRINKEHVAVVNVHQLDQVIHLDLVPPGGIKVVVVAFVAEDNRRVCHGTKPMAELILDIEGKTFKFVQWPDRGTELLPLEFRKGNLAGSIVAVAIRRWKADADFSVDGIEVLQRPLEIPKNDEE